jgi:hypothetical protein
MFLGMDHVVVWHVPRSWIYGLMGMLRTIIERAVFRCPRLSSALRWPARTMADHRPLEENRRDHR